MVMARCAVGCCQHLLAAAAGWLLDAIGYYWLLGRCCNCGACGGCSSHSAWERSSWRLHGLTARLDWLLWCSGVSAPTLPHFHSSSAPQPPFSSLFTHLCAVRCAALHGLLSSCATTHYSCLCSPNWVLCAALHGLLSSRATAHHSGPFLQPPGCVACCAAWTFRSRLFSKRRSMLAATS